MNWGLSILINSDENSKDFNFDDEILNNKVLVPKPFSKAPDSVKDFEASDETVKFVKNRFDIELFEFTTKKMLKIADSLTEEEKEKRKLRRRIAIVSLIALGVSIVAIITLIVFDAIKPSFNLSSEIVIGLFGYLIVHLIATFHFIIKYATDTKHIQSFEVIIHRILEYFISNKKQE